MIFAFLSFLFFFYKTAVEAACPVCILTAGSTFWLAKKLGISDLSSGILMSGILVSSSQFFGDYLTKKYKNIIFFPFSYFLHFIFVPFLYEKEYVIYNANKILNIDIFLFGIIVGFFTSILSFITYKILKKLNNNKPHFNYEKIFIFFVFNIFAMIICSLINR